MATTGYGSQEILYTIQTRTVSDKDLPASSMANCVELLKNFTCIQYIYLNNNFNQYSCILVNTIRWHPRRSSSSNRRKHHAVQGTGAVVATPATAPCVLHRDLPRLVLLLATPADTRQNCPLVQGVLVQEEVRGGPRGPKLRRRIQRLSISWRPSSRSTTPSNRSNRSYQSRRQHRSSSMKTRPTSSKGKMGLRSRGTGSWTPKQPIT